MRSRRRNMGRASRLDAGTRMRRNGSLHAGGFHGLALLTIHVSEGDPRRGATARADDA